MINRKQPSIALFGASLVVAVTLALSGCSKPTQSGGSETKASPSNDTGLHTIAIMCDKELAGMEPAAKVGTPTKFMYVTHEAKVENGKLSFVTSRRLKDAKPMISGDLSSTNCTFTYRNDRQSL